MEGIYDNPYFSNNVYGHVRTLLEQVGVRRGEVHLDFGCGFGRIAEALRTELGLTYLGFDEDARSVASLKERGFEASLIDLRDIEGAREVVATALQGRPVASLSIIDS
jgi:cyclopropane fatty-acyl-phospholipid synthase-like methyltransferase